MADSKIEYVSYVPEVRAAMTRGARRGIDRACVHTAEWIKRNYTGGGRGFKDRTGALRRSIRGGLIGGFFAEDTTAPDLAFDVEGYIGAGGSEVGSDGKETKQYVMFVELDGKFPKPFLLPGTLERLNSIISTFKREFHAEVEGYRLSVEGGGGIAAVSEASSEVLEDLGE